MPQSPLKSTWKPLGTNAVAEEEHLCILFWLKEPDTGSDFNIRIKPKQTN